MKHHRFVFCKHSFCLLTASSLKVFVARLGDLLGTAFVLPMNSIFILWIHATHERLLMPSNGVNMRRNVECGGLSGKWMSLPARSVGVQQQWIGHRLRYYSLWMTNIGLQ